MIGDHTSSSSLPPSQANDAQLHRIRQRQWMYMGAILAAPFAHIGVTLYHSAKTPRAKQLLVAGIAGSTVFAVGMRLVLMAHAGHPGGVNEHVRERELLVTSEQKHEIENPSAAHIVKEAFNGVG
jgi:hypothetical protein